MSAFTDRLAPFFDEYVRLHPIAATIIGRHDHDDRWGDLTETGRAARLSSIDRWEAELRGLNDGGLSRDDRIDRDILLDELAAERFSESVLREDRWDPLSWVYLLGNGIFPLLAREFAPLADRLRSVAARLERVGEVTAAAEASLTGLPDRPISRLHTETAIRQLAGVLDLCNEAVAAGQAAAPSDPAIARALAGLEAGAATAMASVEKFGSYLEREIMPISEGEGRLGPELFAAKLRHALRSDLSPEAIQARAEREFEVVRAEMVRLAVEMWPAWVQDRSLPEVAPGDDRPAIEREIVRTVLDAVGRDHPTAAELLEFCRAELRTIEQFVAKRGLIALPDEPLEIRWTPRFLRSFGGALLDPPGPLDRGQKSFFCVTPLPEEWAPEQVESALREDNDRMLRLLTIHEAVPGHYLQLAYSNRCPSLARAVFGSGVFAEGWALYVTQVMIDHGYEAGDLALPLTHWKFYLRAITNARMDAAIHAGSMTEDEALELMIRDGFQEESEARNKWNRARLTSTQLSTYFVGSVEMWNLEHEIRERAAIASGDPRGRAAVPQPRLVGGYGKTPGFHYPAHLEAVLAHGTPPIPALRRILLGEADA